MKRNAAPVSVFFFFFFPRRKGNKSEQKKRVSRDVGCSIGAGGTKEKRTRKGDENGHGRKDEIGERGSRKVEASPKRGPKNGAGGGEWKRQKEKGQILLLSSAPSTPTAPEGPAAGSSHSPPFPAITASPEKTPPRSQEPSLIPPPLQRSRGNDACASGWSGLATSSEMPLNGNGTGFFFRPFQKRKKTENGKRRRSTVFVACQKLCLLSLSLSLSLANSPPSPWEDIEEYRTTWKEKQKKRDLFLKETEERKSEKIGV